jgi:hypothetical protein
MPYSASLIFWLLPLIPGLFVLVVGYLIQKKPLRLVILIVGWVLTTLAIFSMITSLDAPWR